MTSVFDILAAEDAEGTTLRRKALSLSHKRVTERFSKFLKSASTDLDARLALIEDDFAAVVKTACDEVGYEDSDTIHSVLWAEASWREVESESKTASTEKEARRPKLCPYHSEVIDASLAAGDPGAGYSAMAQHAWGTKHCQSDEWEGGRCSFKPAMTTQSYWDDKKADAEKRREERQQQAEQEAQNVVELAPEGEVEEPAFAEGEAVPAEDAVDGAEVIEVDFGGEADGSGLTQDELMAVAAGVRQPVPLAKTALGWPTNHQPSPGVFLGPDFGTRAFVLNKFNEQYPGLTINGEPYGPQHQPAMQGNPGGISTTEASAPLRGPVELGHPDPHKLQALKLALGEQTYSGPDQYRDVYRQHLGSMKVADELGGPTPIEDQGPEPAVPGGAAGGANSAQCIPGPHGIHNGTVALLGFLDASVNGLSARQQGREIVGTYSPFNREGWAEISQQPVTVSVPHPEYLPAAVEIIEGSLEPANHGQQIKVLAQRMHAGEVPFPPGVSPEQVKIGKVAAPSALDQLDQAAQQAPSPSTLQQLNQAVPPTPVPPVMQPAQPTPVPNAPAGNQLSQTPPTPVQPGSSTPNAQDIHHDFAMLHAGEPGAGGAGHYNADEHNDQNYNQVAQDLGISPEQVQTGLQNYYQDKGYDQWNGNGFNIPQDMANPDTGSLNLPAGQLPSVKVGLPGQQVQNPSPPSLTPTPQGLNPSEEVNRRVRGAVEAATTPTGDSTEQRSTIDAGDGPEPKIDKRKWTPRNLEQRLQTEGENSPHPTKQQDVVHDLNDASRPDNQKKPDQIGENLTEHQDVTQGSGFSGGPANERTWPSGSPSAVS